MLKALNYKIVVKNDCVKEKYWQLSHVVLYIPFSLGEIATAKMIDDVRSRNRPSGGWMDDIEDWYAAVQAHDGDRNWNST